MYCIYYSIIVVLYYTHYIATYKYYILHDHIINP